MSHADMFFSVLHLLEGTKIMVVADPHLWTIDATEREGNGNVLAQSDNRFIGSSERLLEDRVQQAHDLGLDELWVLGDLIESSEAHTNGTTSYVNEFGRRIPHEEVDRVHYKKAANILRNFQGKVVVIDGNNDQRSLKFSERGQMLSSTIPDVSGPRSFFRDIDDLYAVFGLHTMYSDDHSGHIVPELQVKQLERALAETGKRVIVLSHYPLISSSGTSHILNAEEVRGVIESSYKVPLVLSGHSHKHFQTKQKGVHYITLNSLISMPSETDSSLGDAYSILNLVGQGVYLSMIDQSDYVAISFQA